MNVENRSLSHGSRPQPKSDGVISITAGPRLTYDIDRTRPPAPGARPLKPDRNAQIGSRELPLLLV